jgi:hypothetical protein
VTLGGWRWPRGSGVALAVTDALVGLNMALGAAGGLVGSWVEMGGVGGLCGSHLTSGVAGDTNYMSDFYKCPKLKDK